MTQLASGSRLLTRRRWQIATLAIFLVACTGAATGNSSLPELGDASLGTLSPLQERRLGEDFMRKARASAGYLDDPEINEYLQSLGQKLVSHSDSTHKNFRFFAVNDPSINAFAVPGGFVGVHAGLVLAAQSESELASVLAHETAHVSQRHIPRLMAESEKATVPALAAIMAAILIASSGHGSADTGIAISHGAVAALAQHGINYTRTFEEEADRIGMDLLAKSQFDPHGMPAFFERLQSLNRHNETSLPEFLRTHPITTNRIADARNRAAKLHVPVKPDSREFHHVRAKLRALAPGNPADIVRGFRENLAQGKYRDATAERYGFVLALTRARQTDLARSEAAKLRQAQPRNIMFRIAQAEIELAADKNERALEHYAAALRDAPGNGTLVRHYAAALLKAGKTREARELLEPAIRNLPDDPTLYKMYGRAAGETGKLAEAHQALGEYFYLIGNPGAAVQQLQIASRYVGDNFYLQSSIEARMKTIREEIAALSTPAKP